MIDKVTNLRASSITGMGDVLLLWDAPPSPEIDCYEVRIFQPSGVPEIDRTKRTRYLWIDPEIGVTIFSVAAIAKDGTRGVAAEVVVTPARASHAG